MISKHTEIEIKLAGEDIKESEFLAWAFAKNPYKYIMVEGPDKYYKNGDNVVRLRIPPREPPVLTVKKRKSNQSTRDRLEVDLTFDNLITVEDIEAFLTMAGFELDFILHKRAHVFWFENKSEHVDVSYYEVALESKGQKMPPKYFIECEVLKQSEVTPETGKKYLKKWLDDINSAFNLNLNPLNSSLWEIFNSVKEDKSV